MKHGTALEIYWLGLGAGIGLAGQYSQIAFSNVDCILLTRPFLSSPMKRIQNGTASPTESGAGREGSLMSLPLRVAFLDPFAQDTCGRQQQGSGHLDHLVTASAASRYSPSSSLHQWSLQPCIAQALQVVNREACLLHPVDNRPPL